MGNREFQRTMKESISCDQLKLILKLSGMAYNCGDDLTVDMIFKLPWKIREIIVWRIAGDTRALMALVVLFKKTHYVAEVDFEQLRNQFSFNPTKALKGKPFCKLHIPTCKAGKVLHHSFYKEPIWTHSYGYNCKPCKEKFYKPELGNIHNCTKCVYPNTTDTKPNTVLRSLPHGIARPEKLDKCARYVSSIRIDSRICDRHSDFIHC